MRTLLVLLLFPASLFAQQANFAGVNGNGLASTCDLKKANGIVVTGENGEDMNCHGFTLSATVKNKTVKGECKGQELCEEAKKLIKSLKPGNSLYIDQILGENIYGIAVDLPAITVIVAECGPTPE